MENDEDVEDWDEEWDSKDVGEYIWEWMMEPKTNNDIFWKLVAMDYSMKAAFCRIKPP